MECTPENVVRRFVHENEAPALAVQALIATKPTVRAVADGLGVDRTTLFNWKKTGRIPVQGAKNFVLEVERLTGIPRWFCRPDIYGWPRDGAAHTPLGVFVTDAELV